MPAGIAAPATPSPHQNLTVVGDPFQSIYRFLGADPRLLVEFRDAFAGAEVLVLEQEQQLSRASVSSTTCSASPTESARSTC